MSITQQKCSRDDFKQVIQNSYDAIFVIDGQGYVLLCNPATGKMLDVEPQEMVGRNVTDIVKEGIYDNSVALKAIRTRDVATGLLINRHGTRFFATATPVFDDNGDIITVVVNTRAEDIIEKYMQALENESNKAARYKNAAEYLSTRDTIENAIVAESPKMQEIIGSCNYIARSDSTIILFGETGTGKEVIARLVHSKSKRNKEPFIPVNCAAIPSELMESEFFGYAPGAFTGANPRGKAGIFEVAHKGSLFLDEIGELPLSMQSKLLRAIETGEVQRLGTSNTFQTDVRLIAATNRDLQKMVDENKFRSDLYYRLNVIPIILPPLRERPEDILPLARTFLAELNRKNDSDKEFTSQTIDALIAYNWPGNVRELRNVIERLMVTSPGNYLDFRNNSLVCVKSPIINSLSVVKPPLPPVNVYRGTLKSVLKAVEEEYIEQVLAECDGRVGEAADRLGIHRTMLYRKRASM